MDDLCEGNNTLKNKIILVKKQKEVALNENNSLKRKIVEKEKVNVSKKNKFVDHTFHAITKNEVKFLKNKIDCLSSILSKCAFNHSTLESLFLKKQALHVHAHHPQHAYAHFTRHDHTHTHMHPRQVYTFWPQRPFSKVLL